MFYYLSYFKVLFRSNLESHSGGLMTIYITVEPVLRSHCIVRPPPLPLERPHFKHLSLSITGKHLLCKVITFTAIFLHKRGPDKAGSNVPLFTQMAHKRTVTVMGNNFIQLVTSQRVIDRRSIKFTVHCKIN